MSTRATPTRLSGGAGFGYEDKVAAYFLAEMLAGGEPLGSDFGSVAAVDFQAGDGGWLLDDLLITFEERAECHRLAVSVKSNRQVTSNGFPPDFVQAVWSHWLGVSSQCFAKERDLLCLVTGRLADSVNDAWNDMLCEARAGAPQRIAQRFSSRQVSAMKRALFGSLECPGGLPCAQECETAERAALLTRLRLLRFDFRDDPSRDEDRVVRLCRDVLDTRDQYRSGELWEYLLALAKSRREAGGSMSLGNLVQELASRFHLRDHPNYRHDWDILDRLSDSASTSVCCETGNRACLVRAELAKQVSEKLDSNRIVALVGESGSGKSSLAKQLTIPETNGGKLVWLGGDTLDRPNLVEIEQALRLQHSLGTILGCVATNTAFLVLDAVDRFSDEALANAAQILNSLALVSSNCPWRVLITTQLQGWRHAVDQLRKNGLSAEVVLQQIELPSIREVTTLIASFPALNRFLLNRELRTLLRNLKVLDWIADCSVKTVTPDPRAWVGLSDLVDWVWESWIAQGGDRHICSAMLKRIAESEGRSLTVGVPLGELNPAHLHALSELERCGLLRIQNEKAYFTHDLLGDWARLRLLIEEEDGAAASLRSRADHPRWHTAVRLYGVRLLEKGKGNADEWHGLLSTFDASVAHDALVRDLLLESLILAANTSLSLDGVWPLLVSNGGALLSRLLRQFLYFATIPDPVISLIPTDVGSVDELGAFARVPFWPYWGVLISLLRRRIDDIPFACQPSVSEICGLWLKSTRPPEVSAPRWPWRREAAEIALRVAREVQAKKAEDVYFHDNQDEIAYEAALYGFQEWPDQIGALALELCCRREPAPEIQARAQAAREAKAREIQKRLENDPVLREEMKKRQDSFAVRPSQFGPVRAAWPDGPSARVDSAFQRVCFNGSALVSMIHAKPELAREVILALCIREPTPEDLFGDGMLDEYLEIEDIQEMTFPFYFRGPFLSFLRMQPQVGITLILDLANFATDRWLEAQQRLHARHRKNSDERMCPYSVNLGGGEPIREIFGGHHAYIWYRNILVSNGTLVSGLMALEKWLYEQVDAGKDISQWVELILSQSRSTALLGVLVALGKKQPSLFCSTVLPLLGLWEVYEWDQYLVLNDHCWQIERAHWFSSGKEMLQLFDEWHSMAHRRYDLKYLATYLLLCRPEVREFLEKQRKVWLQQFKEEPENEHLELLIARLDPSNYTATPAEGGNIQYGFEWPDHLRGRVEKDLAENERNMRLLRFPLMCRRILDGELALKQEELDAFWSELHSYGEFKEPVDRDDCPHRVQDAIAGGIAVLYSCYPGWLRDNPDRANWCHAQVEAIVSSPPAKTTWDIPESTYNTNWDRFLAEIGVVSLSDDLDNVNWRSVTASSVMSYFYETTEIAMNCAFRVREKLGDDFRRLQNLALLWSALRSVLHRAEYLKADTSRWLRLFDKVVCRFIAKELPAEPLDWHRLANFAERVFTRLERRDNAWTQWPPRERHDNLEAKVDPMPEKPTIRLSTSRSKKHRWPVALDTHVLRRAYAWTWNFEQARDVEERGHFIKTAQMLVDIELITLTPHAQDDEDLAYGPTDYDSWVHRLLVKLLCHLRKDEKPELLWKPILELGPACHHWVESFLTCWHMVAPACVENAEQFTNVWNRMVTFVLDSQTWSEENKLSWRAHDVYIDLMGLRWLSPPQGQEESYAHAIAGLRQLYEKWAKVWLRDWMVMSYFLLFLAKPIARELRCSALPWTLEATGRYSQYDWRGTGRGGLENSLADVLWICWQEHHEALLRNTSTRSAFLSLLNILVARQCPSALALKDKIGTCPLS